ncbi:hypothetical protein EJ05DRAFT_518180 [Pseudovirgaria hyperparasitica]|uniref:Zn(2)-C6 fungal-type domain-containing protein n=1 Tax=Pseudovirgaria hyperparasitica TaxID=470096 RepID=A0A6A6W2D2_9PEZI|nr:uncharacterized protein EJ05DRAFT_518180 [Pseudovirgaria hyperparasitica]KAF2756715.1 hypothetical protein EJ05DRAFT_518180 [Pseudovirgaria hyperparasitica]
MTGEGVRRPLLPQTAQMQSFSFAPPTAAPRENQRNYVFVDEHNRHKRLKVMRACEGCRRRKIKCDAATTNSWPCAACIRLKLNCVPPTVSYDGNASQSFDLDQSNEYHSTSAAITIDNYQRPPPIRQMSGDSSHLLSQSAPTSYAESMRMYPATHYVDPAAQDLHSYGSMQPPPVLNTDLSYKSGPIYSAHSQAPNLATPSSEAPWPQNDQSSSLVEALGELKIDHTAIAGYITNQKKSLAEAPAVEEYEFILPPVTGPDHTVRIPPEMMPSDAQALHYFDYFFVNIHPYIPVISRTYFYQQWQSNRDSISPLMLEAIFACSSLILGERQQGNKWLALASKHEESFKDVPRLSTIQAMLLILKARESVPKRGYFYRSWVTVQSCVQMAKELDLQDHYEIHQLGKSCGSTGADCITKTRVWQTLYILEIVVGGPQGRNPRDFGTTTDTVSFEICPVIPGHDESESQVSRHFTYFTRVIREVTRTTILHFKLRKFRKDWANEPEFLAQGQNYLAWMRDLPQDLQVGLPPDGSLPWIPSHFVANIHCYYYLAIIMHNRVRLHQVTDTFDGTWKQTMMQVYDAAKNMCRLQEAIIHNFGLTGLFFMQRGISFHIYAVLTCTMLHLVAITSPDPDINADARDFFVRHMRILEQVTPHWPVPEMQEQIAGLRQAFSVNTDKPFELKPSFPFGSPISQTNTSPIEPFRSRDLTHNPSLEQPGQVHYNAQIHPITPPVSAHDHDPKTDSPIAQSLVMMAQGQTPQPTVSTPIHQVPQEAVQWNPNRIFDQWNAAFGTPPQSTSSQPSPPLRPPPPGSFEVRTPQDSHPPAFPQIASVSPQAHPPPNVQAQLPPPVSYATQSSAFVTPSMWQDAVASSFPDLKRRWDYSGNQGVIDHGNMSKRQQRGNHG